MTAGELRDLLGRCDAAQEVFVLLTSSDHPHGSQLIIQGVELIPPWRGDGPCLIGLLADAGNWLVYPSRPLTSEK